MGVTLASEGGELVAVVCDEETGELEGNSRIRGSGLAGNGQEPITSEESDNSLSDQ